MYDEMNIGKRVVQMHAKIELEIMQTSSLVFVKSSQRIHQ